MAAPGATADKLKAEGNAFFKASDFLKAAATYAKAIKVDPKNHILYSNRSQAFLKLNKVQKALEDAEKARDARVRTRASPVTFAPSPLRSEAGLDAETWVTPRRARPPPRRANIAIAVVTMTSRQALRRRILQFCSCVGGRFRRVRGL